MDISSEVILLILFLFPGIISIFIFETVTNKIDRKDWKDVALIFIYSIISYTGYNCTARLINLLFRTNFKIYDFKIIKLPETSLILPSTEIIIGVTLISIVVGYILVYFDRYKLLNKLGQLIGATKRYGEEDLWEYLHNAEVHDWVYIRDHKLNLIYYGNITVFSDSEKERELILENVDVYKEDMGIYLENTDYNKYFLYHADNLYISRDRFDLSIAYINIDNKEKENERKKLS